MSEMLDRLIVVAVTPTSVLPPLLLVAGVQLDVPLFWFPPEVVVVPLVPLVPALPDVPPFVGPVLPVAGPVVVGAWLVWLVTPVPLPPAWLIARDRCFSDSRAPQPVTRTTAPISASGASHGRER